MKNIATAIFLGCIALTNAQVIIGDAVGTVPLTPLSVPGVPNKTSVLLEFAAGQNKGIIVPYLTVPLPLASAANRGTILLDASDATKARLKYSNETGWVDLSGQDANLSSTGSNIMASQPASPSSEASSKTIIGATTSAADGVLVLESTTKAMVLPTVADVQNIPSPSPGMMVYVSGVSPTFNKRLAVFNGSKWSFWKP